ncbi:MAG: hypothetical protein MHM6MM_006889 [Cercozoa sp. M6MM]
MSASLYVGDLLPNVTDTAIFEIFNAVGQLNFVRVVRDSQTHKSLGYAYVNYMSADDAERALNTLNFTPIMGRPCRIMWSQRDPTLRKSNAGNVFVKNLDASIDNKTLYDSFSVFGSILSCKIATDENGKCRGYGYVHFENEEDARQTIEKINGMELLGKRIFAEPFRPRSDRHPQGERTFTNVYVKPLAADTDEEALKNMFSTFGEITSAVVMKDDEGKPRGFGFVNFGECDAAAAAVAELHGKVGVAGAEADKPLTVTRAMSMTERKGFLKREEEKRRSENQKRWAGCNLYIKNLSDDITTERLIEEFKQFGDIQSAVVMKDAEGKSRGFGFVCFSAPEEATEALTKMHKQVIGDRPVMISFAERKEQRRARLEKEHAHRMQRVNPMYGAGAQMYFAPNAAQMRGAAPQFGVVAARGGGRYPVGASMPVQGMYPVGMQQPHPQQVARQHRRNKGQRRGQQGRKQQQQGGAAPKTEEANQQYVSNLTPKQQISMLGNKLFPKVQAIVGDKAPKITGMLLGLPLNALETLLQNEEQLKAKVDEAMTVLEAAAQ